MFYKRILQFLIVYFFGLLCLFIFKYALDLSDYVIPSPLEVIDKTQKNFFKFSKDSADTLLVAIMGHILSIMLATIVAIIVKTTKNIGAFIRVAAYNIQAYPIVAVAPIIFILLGDGLSSRLIIASMICYFPLLLSFIGILTQPIDSIEHFYNITGKMTWSLQVKIRLFENMSKLVTVIAGSSTLAMVGTIVAEFIAADAGIGYGIRVALYQSDLAKILVALFIIGIYNCFYLLILESSGALIERKLGGGK